MLERLEKCSKVEENYEKSLENVWKREDWAQKEQNLAIFLETNKKSEKEKIGKMPIVLKMNEFFDVDKAVKSAAIFFMRLAINLMN